MSVASLHDTPPSAASEADGPRNRIVIAILLIAAFVVILNETVMGVALPRLMEDLGITASAGQWLTSAYLLTMAVVIPVTGFLMQRLTTRAVFLLAMSAFSAGTLIAALAPGFPVLLIGRIVQAVGTAIMMPLLMTTVMTLVPVESRGKTMGNISIVISVAPAIGPTISGVILNTLDWRWLFWLVLPIAVGTLVLGYKMMRNVTETKDSPLDVLSVILAALGFGGLVYGLSAIGEGAAHGGASDPLVPLWVAPVVGVVALVLFVLRQIALEKSDRALLSLQTLRVPAFVISLIALSVTMLALFAAVILLPIQMQSVLGLSTLQSGLMMLPGGVLMGVMAPWVGRQYDLRGPKVLALPGGLMAAGALLVLALSGQSVVMLLVGHLMLSVGLALLFTPLISSGMGSLPPHLYSHGSAMLSTVQQVAGAAGIAAMISIMTVRSGTMIGAGATGEEALMGGITLAFLCAAVITLVIAGATLFLKKPEGAGPHMGH